MNLPQEVICIDDQHRPAEFPSSKWIKKDQIYTVIKIKNHVISGGQGFVLQEIDMSGCEPFESFGAWRFAPLHEAPLKEALDVLETPIEVSLIT